MSIETPVNSTTAMKEIIDSRAGKALAKLQLMDIIITSNIDLNECSDELLKIVDGLRHELSCIQTKATRDEIDVTKEQCGDLAELLGIPSAELWRSVMRVNNKRVNNERVLF